MIRRALLGAMALVIVTSAHGTVAAAQEEPPLEDVVLRGRVLRPDGSPLANARVRVDEVKDNSFAFAAFFGTFGLSTLSCFAHPNELCPLPHTKRHEATTDPAGRYQFVFPQAHRRGEETTTDYIFSAALQPRSGQHTGAVASYELELIDAVHDAPDLTLWDPAVTVTRRERTYPVTYQRRADSKNQVRLLVGENSTLPDAFLPDGTVDARAVEDSRAVVSATASKDVRANRTIYHQRFAAATVPLTGTAVPLSRRAACVATRVNGARAAGCGYTDGNLVAAAVPDRNPCRPPPFDTIDMVDPRTGARIPCEPPVTEVRIDLGAVREIGEVRPRCSCDVSTSADGTTWSTIGTGVLPNVVSARHVRLTGASLGEVPEVSVWAPWPASPPPAEATATTTTAAVGRQGDVAAPSPGPGRASGDSVPPLLALLAGFALGAVAVLAARALRTTPGG